MCCLSCRSKAGYADTATVEGHGLPLEGGRAGFKVCVYSDRLCKIFDGCSKIDRKNSYTDTDTDTFAKKKKILPLSKLYYPMFLIFFFYMYMKCFNKIV